MKTYRAIGLMSGSSLDGLDIAYCNFYYETKWHYEIIIAETIHYPEEWLIALQEMPNQSGEKLIEYDMCYGQYLGNQVKNFIDRHKLSTELIGSHGHTIFHNPKMGYTFQLGNGGSIASVTNIVTIADFRIGDIQLGGQGAPLVPIGDKHLFSEYDYCMNIGGIANISFEKDNSRYAMDICPANQLLNYLSNQLGKPYDDEGKIAQLGKMNSQLFNDLNNHNFYSLPYPKSMSNQLVTNSFIPIIDNSKASIEDKLYTVCKHIAYQTQLAIKQTKQKSILITGGGAHNTFLTTAIQKETACKIIIPDKKVVDYKEAMIFAFLGILVLRGEINCIASATGASRDSSSGTIFNP